MATNVGHGAAYIQLRPDTTGFRAEAQSRLNAITLDSKVKLRPDMTGFRAAVRSALATMPAQSVNVKADATALRTSVRTALASMPATSVKVKADLTGSAKAQVAALEAQLSALDGKVVNIRIDLDGAAKALAELAAVTALVNNLDGRTIDIHVNLHGALGILGQLGAGANAAGGRMRALTSAILIFGSAAAPVLAAATGGVVALGGALASVAAGAGVSILALSGVVGAVQALSKAQSEQEKSSALAARQDRQTANAADQVRSALAGVASAERAYSSAQRDALRAQLEINEAREDARRSLEDLESAVRGNDLSIRRSRLELADATRALAAVENLPVDDRRRVEAQLRYDEAKNALDDLTLRQGRLNKEQQAAQRAGVNGAKEVVAAQERARDAQERVTSAAESVAAAYRAVESAQRAAATASVTTSSTSGAALDDLRERLEKLSPAGREFSYFLFNLKDPLLALRREAESGFLPGFQRGLSALLRDLPPFQGFVRRIAETMGDLAERIGNGLTSDRLRPFFSYIDNTASGQLLAFGRVVGNVAEGIGNMFVGFLPVQRQMTGGLVEMTQRFADWSRTLATNKQFQEFVSYVREQGPQTIATIGSLIDVVIDIGQAAAPVGEVVLAFLRGVATAVDAIPTPILTGVVAAIAAMRVAAFVAPLVAGLAAALRGLTFSAVGARAAMTGVIATLGGPWTLAVAAAVTAIGFLVGANAKAKRSIEDIRYGLSEYRDIFAAGITPAALQSANALTAQNAALGDFADRMRQAGITTDEMVRALNGEAEAREKIQRHLDAEIDALKATIDGKGQEILLSDEQKAATEARIAALQGQRRAFLESSIAQERANSLTAALGASTERLTLGIRIARDAFNGTQQTTENYSNALKALGDIGGGTAEGFKAIAGLTDVIAGSQLDAADKAKLFGVAIEEIGSATSRNSAQFDALSSTFTTIAESSLNASDKVKLLRQAMEALYGVAIDQNEAQENLHRTSAALGKQVAQNSAGFDLETGKRRGNTEAVLANRDALQAALLAARESYLQAIAQGVAAEDARKAFERNKLEILKGIEPTQRSSKAVQDLVKIYGEVPTRKTTQVDTPGLNEAILKMIEAHAIQVGLSQRPPWGLDRIATEARLLRSQVYGGLAVGPGGVAVMKADGGYIAGPGGPRDDLIPAWLSNGEYVVKASETAKHLPLLEKINRGEVGSHHAERELGYASGGLVIPRRGDTTKLPLTIPGDAINPVVSVEDSWRQYHAAKAAYEAEMAAMAGGAGFQYLNDVSRTAYKVAQSLNASAKVILSLMEAGIVESGMRNLNYGDRDSVGFLQQRPSQGWPDPMNVPVATRSYLLRAIPREKLHPNWTAGRLAQSVQVSAFPERYDQVEPQARDLIAILSGAGIATLTGDGPGSGRFTPQPRGWPPRVRRKLSPNTAAAQQLVRSRWGLPSYASLERNDPYDHPWGKALDNMTSAFTPRGRQLGDSLARYAVENPGQFGTKYVIWNRRITTDQRGWRGYSGDSPHTDHVHWSFFNKGGLAARKMTSFDRGGDLLPGVTPAYNGTGDREYVATTRADMRNVSLSDETIAKLAEALRVHELGAYTVGRVAQAVATRPTILAVDGRELAHTVADNMSGLDVPGIEVR